MAEYRKSRVSIAKNEQETNYWLASEARLRTSWNSTDRKQISVLKTGMRPSQSQYEKEAVGLVPLLRNSVASQRENEGENMKEKASQKVFTVHGHDEAAKYAVARFVERLGLEAIILDEQFGGLQAIIDKFEEQAEDIGFAIVLLTPDDVGAAKAKKDRLQPRARQNVILELGYFIAKLDRNQVCLLYKEGVELPSDIRGLSYVLLDDYDGWQLKLAREMKHAKLPIDANKLL